jgi:hypothetical protein
VKRASTTEPTRVYADLILRGDGDFACMSAFVADIVLARLTKLPCEVDVRRLFC